MSVKTTVTELPDSRVRLDAEVPGDELEQRIQRAATALGRELRIPGFRKGKVPGPMVIQRVGRDAVVEQAVRDSLPEWYEEAILRSGVSTVGDPKLDVDLDQVPPEGAPLNFSIEVSVTPKATLGRYTGLEVGKRSPEVEAEAIDHELENMRERFARVETVDRPLAQGDMAILDFVGKVDGEPFGGGEARDYMLEIGGGRLIEGFEEQLVGAKAGESRTVEIEFPEDYHGEDLRGKSATFDVDVKDVRQKELPDLDDDFAAEASEFDTIEELRADIEHKLRHAQEHSIEDEFREAVVDAAVDEAKVDLPDELVTARAEEMWDRTERALRAQGIDPETYFTTSGKTREDVIEETKQDAARQLARESVLEAVADAESIEASDEELVEALASVAERERTKPEKVLDRLQKGGRDLPIRREIRLRKAVDRLVESAAPIDPEKAKARDKIWTPSKQRKGEGSAQLWTPEERPRDKPADKPDDPPAGSEPK
jgi:trigger factor